MPQFDGVPTTFYSTLIETMRLSCTVFELQRVICEKLPILTYPTCIFGAPVGVTRLNFTEIFESRKLESLGYHVELFA